MIIPHREVRSAWSSPCAAIVREAGIVAVFVMLALLFFHRFVVSGYAPYWEDLLHYFYPVAHLGVGSQARSLVFWNPYIFSGAPLAANSQAFTFYPFRALFYFLPLDRAMVCLLVGHVAASGAAMYAFLRRCQLSIAPAFIGGVVFMLSSYVVSHFFHVTMTLAVAWTPLVLLSTHLLVRERRLCPAVWGGVASGMQILAGHIQTWYLTMLLCICYSVGLVVFGPSRTSLRQWIRIGALLVTLAFVSLAVSSILLLPMVDVVRRLERPKEAYDFATLYSLGPGFVRLLVPFYFGSPQTNDYWGGWDYWELAGYVGIMPLLLAIVGFVGSRRVERYAIAGVMALGLALAMGSSSVIYYVAYKALPLLGIFRAPARFLLWFTIAVAVLSSFGVEVLLERGKSSRLMYFILSAGAGFLVVLYGLWRLTAEFRSVFDSLGLAGQFVHSAWQGPAEVLKGITAVAQRSAELEALWTVASIAILVLYFFPRRPRLFAFAATTIVTLADLAYAGMSFNLGVRPESMLEPPRTATQLAHGPDSRIYMTETYQKFLDRQYHDYSGFGPGPDYVEGLKTSLYPNINILYGIQSIEGYDPLRNNLYSPLLGAIRSQLKKSGTSTLLDFLGGRYILSDRPLGHFQLRLSAPEGGGAVYENTKAFRKFTIVPAYRVVKTSEEAERLLISGTVDLRNTVLVNKDPFPGRERPAGPLRSSVFIQEYSPDIVRVSVALSRPAVLVMNDTFYPGWRATVDGKPVEILQANSAFRALPLLGGGHAVSFQYRPRWLGLGASVSVVTLLVVIGLTARNAWSKGRRGWTAGAPDKGSREEGPPARQEIHCVAERPGTTQVLRSRFNGL